MASSGVFSSSSRLESSVPRRKIRSDFVDDVVTFVDVRVNVSKFVVFPEFRVKCPAHVNYETEESGEKQEQECSRRWAGDKKIPPPPSSMVSSRALDQPFFSFSLCFSFFLFFCVFC